MKELVSQRRSGGIAVILPITKLIVEFRIHIALKLFSRLIMMNSMHLNRREIACKFVFQLFNGVRFNR